MASIKEAWLTTPPAVTALTVTGLGSLANAASAVSNVIDNWNAGSAAFLDGVFTVSLTTAATGVLATGYASLFLQPSLDNITFADALNDLYVDTIQLQANSTTYAKAISIAASLKGWAPPYYKLRILNQSGAALTAGSVNYNLPYNTVV